MIDRGCADAAPTLPRPADRRRSGGQGQPEQREQRFWHKPGKRANTPLAGLSRSAPKQLDTTSRSARLLASSPPSITSTFPSSPSLPSPAPPLTESVLTVPHLVLAYQLPTFFSFALLRLLPPGLILCLSPSSSPLHDLSQSFAIIPYRHTLFSISFFLPLYHIQLISPPQKCKTILPPGATSCPPYRPPRAVQANICNHLVLTIFQMCLITL